MRNFMKKAGVIFALCCSFIIVAISAAACTWYNPATWFKKDKKTPIVCTIRFAKSVDEKGHATEFFTDKEFPINTRIYVIVDFTFTNYEKKDGYVDFKVRIPHAKYYAVSGYKAGVVVPTQDVKIEVTPNGEDPMIELSNMVFRVKPGENTPYTYCIEIEANTVCEDAEFRAIFTSEDGVVIKSNQVFKESYFFVEE